MMGFLKASCRIFAIIIQGAKEQSNSCGTSKTFIILNKIVLFRQFTLSFW